MSNLVIVDNEQEVFKKSECNCTFCQTMHGSVIEWDSFVPTTAGQKIIKDSINRISDRETQRHNKRKEVNTEVNTKVNTPPSLRRSPRLAAIGTSVVINTINI